MIVVLTIACVFTMSIVPMKVNAAGITPLEAGVIGVAVGAAATQFMSANGISNTTGATDLQCKTFCALQQTKANQAQPPNPSLACPPAPGTTVMPCSSPMSGGTASGFCEINGCKATSFSALGGGSGTPGGSSMSQLLQAAGQLLGQLMSGGSGSGSGSGSGTGTDTTCPSGETGTYPNCTLESCPSGDTGIYPDCIAQTCPSGDIGVYPDCVPISSNNAGDTVSASPVTGAAPLTVTATFSSGAACSDAYDLSWGDGSSDVTMQYVAPASGSTCTQTGQTNSPTHSYTTPGTYTITLTSGISLQYSNTATVDVTSVVNPDLTTTADVTGTFVAPNSQTGTTTPGLSGGIQTTGTGATFTANNVQDNTETSAFFGGDTIGGFVSNLVGGWCHSRPWAGGLIASIIPPSFFDGLCSSGGFAVGTPTAAVATSGSTNQTSVVLTQTKVQQTTPTQTTLPTTQLIPARVDIWAVPSTVPLGARTTIFWNTENVTNCTETSPDGSFSQTSLSGGAATVPLTEATTFTISCLDSQQNPATDYVTVSIAG